MKEFLDLQQKFDNKLVAVENGIDKSVELSQNLQSFVDVYLPLRL